MKSTNTGFGESTQPTFIAQDLPVAKPFPWLPVLSATAGILASLLTAWLIIGW